MFYPKSPQRSLMWCMGLVRDTVTPASPSSRQMSRVARGNQQTHPPSCLSTFCLTTTNLLPTVLVLRRPLAGGSWRNHRGHTLSDECCYISRAEELLTFWSWIQPEGSCCNRCETSVANIAKSRHPMLTNFISDTTFEMKSVFNPCLFIFSQQLILEDLFCIFLLHFASMVPIYTHHTNHTCALILLGFHTLSANA